MHFWSFLLVPFVKILYYLQLCTKWGNGLRIPSQKQSDDKNLYSFVSLSHARFLQRYNYISHPAQGLIIPWRSSSSLGKSWEIIIFCHSGQHCWRGLIQKLTSLWGVTHPGTRQLTLCLEMSFPTMEPAKGVLIKEINPFLVSTGCVGWSSTGSCRVLRCCAHKWMNEHAGTI